MGLPVYLKADSSSSIKSTNSPRESGAVSSVPLFPNAGNFGVMKMSEVTASIAAAAVSAAVVGLAILAAHGAIFVFKLVRKTGL